MKKLELKNLKIKALSPEDKASIDGGYLTVNLFTVFANEACPLGLTHIPQNPGGPCSSNEQ